MAIGVLVFLFLVLAGLLAWMGVGRISVRQLEWLRLFFPSWRFFDSVDRMPQLLYRVGPTAQDWSDWMPALSTKPRKVGALFLNPQGQLHLASQGLVDRLLNEAADARTADLSVTTSYLLVENLIRGLVSAGRFQFKIRMVDASESGRDEDVLISAEHEV